MSATCPLCKNRAVFLYTIDRFSPPLPIYRCEVCGHQMQHPLPKNPDEYYKDSYYSGAADFSYRDERKTSAFDAMVHRARLRTIARHVAPPADFLDLGAAFGGLVQMANNFGYRAKGLDVSSYAAGEAQKRKIPVEAGIFARSEPIAQERFDILTMIEVIEHIANPQELFATLQTVVRPGGLVVIQTADFDGWQAVSQKENYSYYLPGHLHYYRSANLIQALKSYGFDQFQVYRPVDFGLLPKLRKSRGSFQSLRDYLRWFPIALYHFRGHLSYRGRPLTSSMVLYARRAR